MSNTFDLSGLDEDVAAVLGPAKTATREPIDEVNEWEWAESVIQKAVAGEQSKAVIFDIETGPRPLPEIEHLYVPPEALPPWDESMVKYGNAKREELRSEKRAEQFEAYKKLLDAQGPKMLAHKAEWLGRAALSPVTGRVLLIGTLAVDDKPAFFDYDDEAEMLADFWEATANVLADRIPLIGHNSNIFDLPFLIRRSWMLGVPVPREVRQGRHWNPLFRDTMEFWNCGARDYVKLNALGDIFGVGQKTEGVSGGDFAKLWWGEMPFETWGTPEDQRRKAYEYNAQDLRLTAAIAAKMGMI